MSARMRPLAGNVIVRNVGLAVACCLAGWACERMGKPYGSPTLLWPPLGLGLGAVWHGGMSLGPGLLAGSWLAHLVSGSSGGPALVSAVGDTLAVLAAKYLLGRFAGFQANLKRVQDVLALLSLAVVVGAAMSSSFDSLGLALAGHSATRGGLVDWWTEWMRDGLGMLTLTPVILVWGNQGWNLGAGGEGWLDRKRRPEALLLLVLLCASCLLVFGESYPTRLAGSSVAYLVFAFSFWSALRFGPRGAAGVIFLVAVFSAGGTARRLGPFGVEMVEDMVLLWGVFNGVFAVCALLLAAVMAERQTGETALLGSEARYRHLFSDAPISIWEEDFSELVQWQEELRRAGVTDFKAYATSHPEALSRASGLVRVTDINDVTLKMFEAERREQFLGDLSRLVRPETRSFFLEEIQAIWEGRLRFDNEVSGYTLKGRRIDYLIHWDASTESGPPDWAHVIVAILDITERQRLREQFRQAQKMDAVGRLAGGIAHDFNNLIMTIQGYSSLLLSDPATGPTQRDEAEQIKRAAERAAALTRQLLAFSRKQVLKPRVLALNTVVSDMNKMLRRLIGQHIEFESRLAEDLGWVKADLGQVEQVILNLAINARDAMARGGKLVVETANHEVDGQPLQTQTGLLPTGRYVTLTFSDTGCGMSATVKAHLFEPFFTTKGAELGTGLGLSTVYGIIKQSGGDITVSSEEGAGTTFRIFLPRVNQPESRDQAGQPFAFTLRGTETVLVAEDEDPVRRLLCKSLSGQGYSVLEAMSGNQALDIAERVGRIDLLVTDIVMPGLSGHDLAAQLAQRRAGLKILFVSGHTDRTVLKSESWPVGAAFLPKPFTTGDLLLKVRDILDGTSFFRFTEMESKPVVNQR